MAEFKTITTQEEFDMAIKDRLERADRKVRDEFKGWMSPDEVKGLRDSFQKDLKDLKDAHSKEMEKYSGYDDRFKAQEDEIKSLKVSAMKVRIATEKKLPMEAIDFLQGDSEETISESADRLSRLTGPSAFTGFTRNTEKDMADDPKERGIRELARKFGESK